VTDACDVAPTDVLAFWRAAGPDRWYTRDEAFDTEVRRRFVALWRSAAAGKLTAWEQSDDGALALVIVLDQFPRNMFRGDARAFSSDAMACEVANRAVDRGTDARIAEDLREFLYLPLMHSEHLFGPAPLRRSVSRGGQRRQPQIRRGPCRDHQAVRPLPSPQPNPGTCHDGGRTGLFGRGRVFWLTTQR